VSITKKIRKVKKEQSMNTTALTRLIQQLTYSFLKLDCGLYVVSDFVTIIDVISHGTEAVVCVTQSTVIITGIRGGGFNDNRMIRTGRNGLTHAIGFVR
jgi:signal recognition particle GTPase